MKKKSLKAFMLLFPTVLILLACGCPVGQSNKKTEMTPEEIAEKYKNVPLDPYGCYIEEEEWISERKGFYLVRDDVHYSLNDIVSIKERPEYNVGNVYETGGYQSLFVRTSGKMGEDDGLYVNTTGDFDLLVLNEETDEIRSYGVSTVGLYKLDSLNYGFGRDMTAEGMGLHSGMIETTDGQKIISDKSKELQYELDGEILEHNYNLEKGTKVTVSWYEGTDYYEYTCIADTRYYYSWEKDSLLKVGDSSVGPIQVEGQLNKEGYATYDFSGIEPGIYLLLSIEQTEYKFGDKSVKGGGVLVIE